VLRPSWSAVWRSALYLAFSVGTLGACRWAWAFCLPVGRWLKRSRSPGRCALFLNTLLGWPVLAAGVDGHLMRWLDRRSLRSWARWPAAASLALGAGWLRWRPGWPLPQAVGRTAGVAKEFGGRGRWTWLGLRRCSFHGPDGRGSSGLYPLGVHAPSVYGYVRRSPRRFCTESTKVVAWRLLSDTGAQDRHIGMVGLGGGRRGWRWRGRGALGGAVDAARPAPGLGLGEPADLHCPLAAR
jgi:hypothetical protein